MTACSPWGRKESDTMTFTFTHTIRQKKVRRKPLRNIQWEGVNCSWASQEAQW